MEEIVSAFKIYFSFLEKHRATYEDGLSTSNKALIKLSNLSEKLIALSTTPVDSNIFHHFPTLKYSLEFKILMALEQHFRTVTNFIDELEESTNYLNKNLVILENTLEKIGGKSIMETSEFPTIPLTIDQLWEYALDCRQYYQALYSGIRTSHCCVDFRDLQTILKLKKAFNEDEKLKRQLNRCLAVGKLLQFEV